MPIERTLIHIRILVLKKHTHCAPARLTSSIEVNFISCGTFMPPPTIREHPISASFFLKSPPKSQHNPTLQDSKLCCKSPTGGGGHVHDLFALLGREGDDGQEGGGALQHVMPRHVLRRRPHGHAAVVHHQAHLDFRVQGLGFGV